MQISGSALSYPPTVNPAGPPLSNDALHKLFRASTKKGGNRCLFWLHPPPPSPWKTAMSLWSLNELSVKLISVSGKVLTERNPLPSKSRREREAGCKLLVRPQVPIRGGDTAPHVGGRIETILEWARRVTQGALVRPPRFKVENYTRPSREAAPGWSRTLCWVTGQEETRAEGRRQTSPSQAGGRERWMAHRFLPWWLWSWRSSWTQTLPYRRKPGEPRRTCCQRETQCGVGDILSPALYLCHHLSPGKFYVSDGDQGHTSLPAC